MQSTVNGSILISYFISFHFLIHFISLFVSYPYFPFLSIFFPQKRLSGSPVAGELAGILDSTANSSRTEAFQDRVVTNDLLGCHKWINFDGVYDQTIGAWSCFSWSSTSFLLLVRSRLPDLLAYLRYTRFGTAEFRRNLLHAPPCLPICEYFNSFLVIALPVLGFAANFVNLGGQSG